MLKLLEVVLFFLSIFGLIFGERVKFGIRSFNRKVWLIALICSMALIGATESFERNTSTPVATTGTTAVTKQEDTKPKTEMDKETTEKVKQFMYENFGGNGNDKLKTSWYGLITDIQVTKGYKVNLNINTSIYHDNEGKKVAENIGNVVSANSEATFKIKFDNVTVYDKDGHTLFSK